MVKSPDKAKENETGTQSIERALAILSCFLGERGALSLTEISKKAEIPLPTASRIARLFVQEGFLSRNEDNKLFSIGRKLYMLGYRSKREDTLRGIVHGCLVDLRNTFGETATAYIREGTTRRCFDKAEASHEFRYSPTVGAEYKMGVGAGAKIFLAFMPEENQREILQSTEPLTPFTATGEKLFAELEEIRRNGIAKSFDEYCEGFSSLGCPVFNSKNEVICTMALTGPTARFTPAMVEEASRKLLDACTETSRSLGWTGEFAGLLEATA